MSGTSGCQGKLCNFRNLYKKDKIVIIDYNMCMKNVRDILSKDESKISSALFCKKNIVIFFSLKLNTHFRLNIV